MRTEMPPTPLSSAHPRAPRLAPAPDEPLFAPRLALGTEPCSACAALLAVDQRYCLSCGERRAGTRVPFPTAAAVATTTVPVLPPRRRAPLPASALSALYGLAGAGALALGLLAGALIVRGNDTPAPIVAAAATAVATAAATVAAPVATATPVPTVAASFTADWPAGQNGWTIQLSTLPKDGTTPEAIATAKADATGQGATDAGALDSDAFASLDGGNYVIYSGVFTTKREAEDAFSTLQANFPDASVVEVTDKAPEKTVKKSSADLKKEEASKTPEEAQRDTRKAPPTVESEGPAPTPDGKKPGGDSDEAATEIG
jgi:hypothetical protein